MAVAVAVQPVRACCVQDVAFVVERAVLAPGGRLQQFGGSGLRARRLLPRGRSAGAAAFHDLAPHIQPGLHVVRHLLRPERSGGGVAQDSRHAVVAGGDDIAAAFVRKYKIGGVRRDRLSHTRRLENQLQMRRARRCHLVQEALGAGLCAPLRHHSSPRQHGREQEQQSQGAFIHGLKDTQKMRITAP